MANRPPAGNQSSSPGATGHNTVPRCFRGRDSAPRCPRRVQRRKLNMAEFRPLNADRDAAAQRPCHPGVVARAAPPSLLPRMNLKKAAAGE